MKLLMHPQKPDMAVGVLDSGAIAVSVHIRDALDYVREVRGGGTQIIVSPEVKKAFFREVGIDSDTPKRIAKSELFNYQKEDSIWLASKKTALLASQMGTGKTPLTVMALPHNASVVVVCPAVIKQVWFDEINRWRPEFKKEILSGRDGYRHPEKGEVVILNYDILPRAWKPPEYPIILIADECHYLKNTRAARTKRFRKMSKTTRNESGKVWLISGTPLMNKPFELWNILGAAKMEEKVFGSWPNFLKLYKMYQDGFGAWKWGKPDESIPNRIAMVAIRRTRKEVLPELPDKFYRRHDVTIKRSALIVANKFVDQTAKVGVDLESAIDGALNSAIGTVEFEEFSAARMELSVAKIPYMLQLVEMHEDAEDPIVVFSCFKNPIRVLGERDDWMIITGDVDHKRRAEIVKAFQEGKLKGIGLTIQAGGEGITLTRAHQVIFVDQDPTPARNLQAEDRLMRIGQTKGVIISRIVADHQLDRRMYAINVRKQKLIEASGV